LRHFPERRTLAAGDTGIAFADAPERPDEFHSGIVLRFVRII
jgi:hypothetical protein